MDIGAHCAVCGKLDFLPFDCHKCGKSFCLNDRQHSCTSPSETAKVNSINRAFRQPLQGPTEKKAEKPTETSERPTRNAGHHWAKPDKTPQANAEKLSAGSKLGGSKGPKNERARAALDRLRDLMGVKPKPAKPVSKAQEALDRRNAFGDALIPQQDRVYFTVERVEHEYTDELTKTTVTRPRKVETMFFDKKTSAGRILDQISKHLALPHASLQDTARKTLEVSVLAEQLPSHLVVAPKE